MLSALCPLTRWRRQRRTRRQRHRAHLLAPAALRAPTCVPARARAGRGETKRRSALQLAIATLACNFRLQLLVATLARLSARTLGVHQGASAHVHADCRRSSLCAPHRTALARSPCAKLRRAQSSLQRTLRPQDALRPAGAIRPPRKARRSENAPQSALQTGRPGRRFSAARLRRRAAQRCKLQPRLAVTQDDALAGIRSRRTRAAPCWRQRELKRVQPAAAPFEQMASDIPIVEWSGVLANLNTNIINAITVRALDTTT